MRNLAASVIRHERVKTTLPKAKEVRSFLEPLITLSKKGDLHSRRLAAARLQDKEATRKLFDDLAPLFQERNGGYTRILRMNDRRGDGAPLCYLELVEKSEEFEG